MLRWILLAGAGGLLGLGLLTVRPMPDWGAWKLAVLAEEFGHWLAIGALVVAGAGAWNAWRGEGGIVAGTAAGVAAAAAGLLLVPTWQAARIARELPEKMRAQFGDGRVEREAFTVGGFFSGEVEPVNVETFEVSAGLPLDFYRPVRERRGTAELPERAPCVVVVHGGGWDSGDRKQLPELNHWLARRGYAVAAVSYRLAPKHRWPAQREDVVAAIAVLKARADLLGIDRERLVLLGRSAGGQIAQVVAYTAKDPAIRGLIALYAPSDLYFGYVNTHENDMLHSPALMRQFLGGPPERVRERYESASGLNFVARDSPPTLLLHGRNDVLAWYRHSERLAARLHDVGVRHVHVQLPWATHAFDFNLRGPGGQITTWAIEEFLSRVTR